ncbi:hypothetical protein [Streptomyces humi]
MTFTGDKTAPDTLKLYMRLFIGRVRDGDTDGLEELSRHSWFARRSEAAGARWFIRSYGGGAAGPVSINMTEEDPYDVRGGTIRRTVPEPKTTREGRDVYSNVRTELGLRVIGDCVGGSGTEYAKGLRVSSCTISASHCTKHACVGGSPADLGRASKR